MQILDMEKDGRSMYSDHCVLNGCVSNSKESVEGKGSGRVPETIVKCQTSTTLRKLKEKKKWPTTGQRGLAFGLMWVRVGPVAVISWRATSFSIWSLPLQLEPKSSTVPLIYAAPVSYNLYISQPIPPISPVDLCFEIPNDYSR